MILAHFDNVELPPPPTQHSHIHGSHFEVAWMGLTYCIHGTAWQEKSTHHISTPGERLLRRAKQQRKATHQIAPTFCWFSASKDVDQHFRCNAAEQERHFPTWCYSSQFNSGFAACEQSFTLSVDHRGHPNAVARLDSVRHATIRMIVRVDNGCPNFKSWHNML